MGKFDDINYSLTPSTSRLRNSRNHSSSPKHGNNRIRDRCILKRLNQYLNENKDRPFVSVDIMADDLRLKYREYRRRNLDDFKTLIARGFKVLSNRESMDEPNLSESSSDVEEYNEISEARSMNTSNSQLKNLYSRNNDSANDLELINLSSDEESGQKDLPAGSSSYVQKTTLKNNSEVSVIRFRAPQENHNAEGMVNISFADFGGSPNVLQEVCKLILHVKHPEVFKSLGITAPRGFLLHGPPGCGKTLLASAIAGELAIPLIKVSGPELVGGVSGESEERIRELFASALARAPCVLFIDEVDAITPNRQTAQREMERRIVAQLLTSLDDLAVKDESGQVLVIGATKRPDSLDPALRRAGRFDREVSLGIPDEKSRLEILRVLCSKVNLFHDLDLETLARMTPGFVGADLLSLIRESALVAITRVFEGIEKSKKVVKSRKRKMPDVLPYPKKLSLDKSVSETQTLSTDSGTSKEIEVIVNDKSEQEDKKETVNGDEVTEKEPEKVEDSTKPISIEIETDDNPIIEVSLNEPAVVNMEVDSNDSCKNGTDENQSPKANDDEDELSIPSTTSSLSTLLFWLRNVTKLSPKQLKRCAIQQSDLTEALRTVQPSAKREGFATVPDVSWEDVGSLISVREHLKLTILGPIKYEAQFERLGLVAPAGVLLCGPPGCGKTLLAKAVANEAGINFISVKGPELLNMYVGESERAVRTVFQRARNSVPCVIFFDELDALCPRRTEGDAGAGMRVVNQMLTEMDGIGDRKGVFLMAATNRPDIVDPAVLRPGRLDRTIYIGMPNASDRKDILLAITKKGTKPPFASDVCLETFSARTELNDWTGADLAALVKEAAMQAIREEMILSENKELECSSSKNISVTNAHLEHALKTVRPSVSPKDLKRYEKMRLEFAAVPDLT